MDLPSPLAEGRLIRRYKRFLADVELADGETVTAHIANPGSMLGLADPGIRVWLSRSDNPRRKLKYSWELAEIDLGGGPVLVGMNTNLANRLAVEAIEAGLIFELAGYESLRREVPYGRNSRIDILLEKEGAPPCYVEVKNVHLMRRPGLAEFPDSVTKRGAKHLAELGDMAEGGARAVMLYIIQRGDAESLALARDIDAEYGTAFDKAKERGVEACAYACALTLSNISVKRTVPFNN